MGASTPNHTTWSQHYILSSPPPPQQSQPQFQYFYGSPTATVDYSRKFYNSPSPPHPQPNFYPPTSRPPFASIENIRSPPPCNRPVKFCATPVKVEEDVLVMDGILIDSPSTGKGIGNARLVKSPLDCGPLSPGRSVESKSPRSGRFVKSSHLSPRNATNPYNSQLAQGKEDFRSTRYSNNNKPEFSLGKEDVRPTQHFKINKPEGLMCRSLTLEGSSTNDTEIRSDPAASELAVNQKVDQYTGSSNWLPTDDGIGVELPFLLADESPSRKAIDACILAILYGPRKKQRLPVFKEICPE